MLPRTRTLAALAVCLVLGSASWAGAAADAPPAQLDYDRLAADPVRALPVPDGPVGRLTLAGDRVFVRGEFTRMGPYTGHAAQLDLRTGAVVPTAARVVGCCDVQAVVADGQGGWYLGGIFAHVGERRRLGLIHVLADGTLDERFDARMIPGDQGATVTALALGGGRLYVGGAFRTIGGRSRAGLAALDPATGAALEGFDAQLTGEVIALAADAERVYVGGKFTRAGGADRSNVAALDGRTGAADPGFASAGDTRRGVDAPVRALALGHGRLYVGGEFTAAEGRARNRLAAFGLAGGALDASFDPSADATVAALAVSADRVYAGGRFGFVGGAAVARVAAVDPATGAVDAAFRADGDEGVEALAVGGDRLIAAGTFTTLGGQPRQRLAALDLRTGAADPAFDPAPDERVRALAVAGTRVLAGGELTTAGGERRSGIAALDAASGALTPELASAALTGAGAMSIGGGRVYITEPLDPEFPGDRARLRALDPGTGADVAGFAPVELGWFSPLAATGDGVCFVHSRARRVSHVRCLDARGRERRRLRLRVSGRLGSVEALAARGRRLYVAGSFTRVDGARRSSLAAVDLRTGRVVRRFRPRRVVDAERLAITRGRVYAAGRVRRGRRASAVAFSVRASTGRALRVHVTGVQGGGRTEVVVSRGVLWVLDDERFVAVDGRGRKVAESPGQLSTFGEDVFAMAVTPSFVLIGGRFGTTEGSAPEDPPRRPRLVGLPLPPRSAGR